VFNGKPLRKLRKQFLGYPYTQSNWLALVLWKSVKKIAKAIFSLSSCVRPLAAGVQWKTVKKIAKAIFRLSLYAEQLFCSNNIA